MKAEYGSLTPKIIKLLERDPGQPVHKLAKELKINRTYLAGYLRALENEGHVKSKRIGPAKVYFKKSGV
jgi:predicted transcriptional regulator